jgi:predicted GIY-YIG superfamily endonuclease
MYYVYIIYSESVAKLYIGQINDIEKRLKRLNAGYEKFTKKGMPWSLKFFVEVESRVAAMKLEKRSKISKAINYSMNGYRR